MQKNQLEFGYNGVRRAKLAPEGSNNRDLPLADSSQLKRSPTWLPEAVSRLITTQPSSGELKTVLVDFSILSIKPR